MISHEEHHAHHREEKKFSSFKEAMAELGLPINAQQLLALAGITTCALVVFILANM